MLKYFLFVCLPGFFCIQFIRAEVQEFPSGGIHKDPEPDQKKQIGPDCYFKTETLSIPNDYRMGFSWYSASIPIFKEVIPGIQIGLASTWITTENGTLQYPDVKKLLDACVKDEKQMALYQSWGPGVWQQFQSMEGSLGYWAHTRFHTRMPKYKPDAWKNFYTYSVSGPGFNVSDGSVPTPLLKGYLGPVYLSNTILIPPDGLPTTEKGSGGFLGVAWYPLGISKEWRADFTSTWTLFLKAKNFQGPIMYHPEEFWDGYPGPENLQNLHGLNRKDPIIYTMASEWGTIPYKRLADSKQAIWSKIPKMSFPVDADGRTVLLRDVRTYSKGMGQEVTDGLLAGERLDLSAKAENQSKRITLSAASPPHFQDGKRLELAQGFKLVTFDNETAFGFQWDDKKEGIQELPSYFKEEGDARRPVQESEVPHELVQSKFKSAGDTNFKFETPAWWFEAAEVDPKEYTAELTDKTTVTYRWVRFKDQPAVKALKLTEEQRDKLQKTVEKIHKSCAAGSDFMAPPTKGELAEFDPGLLVNPPEGKEVGWVPLIVRQEIVAR